MIISASRRTDIPAFYADWFINRVREGYCEVPNPFNPRQVAAVSLKAQDVDWIVFWTRSPRPLMRYLEELDDRGFGYYFQFTLLDYPAQIDSHTPSTTRALDTFRLLTDRIGAERVIWRYDPIVLSEITPVDYHLERFERLAAALQGYTKRVVASLLDVYAKARRRLEGLQSQGARLLPVAHEKLNKNTTLPDELTSLFAGLGRLARAHNLEIQSCAEEIDLAAYGISAGKCIDGGLIERLSGRPVIQQKDPGQRKACGCVVSKDIGMYDSCLFGCRYCYATRSFEQARYNYAAHDPQAASLYAPGSPR
ncbi:MAG: hypothetical protein B6D39_03790 [Anaerolineae bacterium UTCFX2]|jgi:hypothetical protein|nr:DUF1848 domain-containing protein [Anaerolineae bacterium]MCZ7552142.1 DUF1848 domain-containing protein [Anaerolineales bacterium]OQY93016.1 MAG: hypothetical protein B6D39_03790 [Anaerolineae bacterium UTCFX2]